MDLWRPQVEHLTGDLWRLRPTESFSGFKTGEPVVVPFVCEYWALFETDFMPRWYIAAASGVAATPRVLACMETEDVRQYASPILGQNWKRTPADNNILMSAAARHTKYTRAEQTAEPEPEPATLTESWAVLPTPLEYQLDSSAELVDAARVCLLVEEGALPAAGTAALVKASAELAGVEVVLTPDEASLTVRVSVGAVAPKAAAKAGGYLLTVRGSGDAAVVGHDASGAFYGLQSLLSLLARSRQVVPALRMVDAPRLVYRGLQVINVAQCCRLCAVLLSICCTHLLSSPTFSPLPRVGGRCFNREMGGMLAD